MRVIKIILCEMEVLYKRDILYREKGHYAPGYLALSFESWFMEVKHE